MQALQIRMPLHEDLFIKECLLNYETKVVLDVDQKTMDAKVNDANTREEMEK